MLRGSKAESYEGGVRVPFIVHGRGTIPEGKTLRQAISNVDILPTLIEWTGARQPQLPLDGQSIATLLTSRTADHLPHRPIYIVNYGKAEAVKHGDWKYRRIPAGTDQISGLPYEGTEELFNLAWDPAERSNLLLEHPDKAKELREIFEAFDGNVER